MAVSWNLDGNQGTDPARDFLGTVDEKPLIVKTTGQERLRVSPEGNVGIGGVSPVSRLTISSPTPDQNEGTIHIAVTNKFKGAHRLLTGRKPHSSGKGDLDWTLEMDAGDTPGLNLFRAARPKIGQPAFAVPLYISWSGNVGVGTSTPAGILHVASRTSSETPQVVVEQSTRDDFARLRFITFRSDPDTEYPVPCTHWDIASGQEYLQFRAVGKPDVMTMTTDGRVGIQTKTPETALHVNGEATVSNLHLTGGSDIAEAFRVDEAEAIVPGTVMVIDDDNVGSVRVSNKAYDSKVAGIASGANQLRPGLTLGHDHRSEALSQATDLALSGRVFCKAEAVSSPIRPGDLLTTSRIPGHAMKAASPELARGAVIGKAMSGLEEGKGLVLVLLSLQ